MLTLVYCVKWFGLMLDYCTNVQSKVLFSAENVYILTSSRQTDAQNKINIKKYIYMILTSFDRHSNNGTGQHVLKGGQMAKFFSFFQYYQSCKT